MSHHRSLLHLYSIKFVTLNTFSYELLIVTYEIRLYLILLKENLPVSAHLGVRTFVLVVEPSFCVLKGLAADCPLSKNKGDPSN